MVGVLSIVVGKKALKEKVSSKIAYIIGYETVLRRWGYKSQVNTNKNNRKICGTCTSFRVFTKHVTLSEGILLFVPLSRVHAQGLHKTL
jgi:hypothetical protein